MTRHPFGRHRPWLLLLAVSVTVCLLLASEARAERDALSSRVRAARDELHGLGPRGLSAEELERRRRARLTDTLRHFEGLLPAQEELPTLSDRLRGLCHRSEVEAVRIEYRPRVPDRVHPYTRLHAVLTVEGRYANIRKVLHSIETDPVLLALRQIRIERDEGRDRMVFELDTCLRPEPGEGERIAEEGGGHGG